MSSGTKIWQSSLSSKLPKPRPPGLHLLLFPNHYVKFKALKTLFDHYVQDGFIIYLDLEFHSPLLVKEIHDKTKRRAIIIRDDEPNRLLLPQHVSVVHPRLRAYFVDSMSSLYLHYLPVWPDLDANRALVYLLLLCRKVSQDIKIPFFIIHTTREAANAPRRIKPLSERLWRYIFDTTTAFRMSREGELQVLPIEPSS